jgi:hypothetical protein
MVGTAQLDRMIRATAVRSDGRAVATAWFADDDGEPLYLNTGWSDETWSGELSVYRTDSGARRWHRRVDADLVPRVEDDGTFWTTVTFAAGDTRLVCGTATGERLAFDTASGELTGRTRVGAGPVRTFGLAGDTVWTDGGGGPVAAPLGGLLDEHVRGR